MRSSILAAIVLLAVPGAACAQYYGGPGYGAAPGYGVGTGYGYGAPGGYGTTGYGGVPSYGAGVGYGQYGYGQSPNYGAPYQQPGAVGGFYGQNPTYGGAYQPRTPEDVMTPGRVRTDSSRQPAQPGLAPSVPLPGAAAPVAVERKNPKGQRFEGFAKVVDGNTFVLGSEVIVLDGADAPELGQTCTEQSGLEWQCGKRARDRLQQVVGGQRIVCVGIGFAGPGIAARCTIGMTDIGRQMVAEGWAMSPKAVSAAYIGDEAKAKADHRGVWAGTAGMPWTYRAKN